ncbi:MAG: hypothetical protein MUO67_23795 [Anaerolineales bacterium]|nr:hypothetical protein [Anaerolineales bacterium]
MDKVLRLFSSLVHWSGVPFVLLMGILLLAYSTVPPGDQLQQVRAFTRHIEFDYVTWTLNALGGKIRDGALGTQKYLADEQVDRQVVLDYIDLVERIQRAEGHLENIYADPEVSNPDLASALVRRQLDEMYVERKQLAPLAEEVLQSQVTATVAELGLTYGGQPFPPVLFSTTTLPTALIVSPRDAIRQDHNISLPPDMTADERTALEGQVDAALDVSSLVVNVGGIGLYPTMVMQSTNMNWLAEVISHEWTHNFLTLRPMGVSYMANPELRTMNETAASIAGKEIGSALIERYYPELVPPPTPAETPDELETDEPPPDPPPFDFRTEMRITRERADDLLAEGKIEEAEEYMEARRQIFWEHGYRIRKLNQAYFAFYGAYADLPDGAAGEDPVGEAVRDLRAESPTLADFLKRISWMTSFEQLQEAAREW